MRARTFVVLTVVVVIGATACGSSSKGATTITSTTAGSSAGSGSGSFCDLARKDRAAFSGASIAATTPAKLKVLYENLGAALDQARAAAPTAIQGDFDTFITAYRPFLRDLVAVNYDFKRLRRAALLGLSLRRVRAASLRIQEYMRQVCKIPLTPTT